MEGNTLEQLVFEDYFNDPSADNLALMISCSCNLRVCERQVYAFAKRIGAPFEMVMQTKQLDHLPVLKYAAAGIATPTDAALMMQLGCDGVFVGSGVFNSLDPVRRARAIVQAVNKLSLGLFDMGAYCYLIYQTW